MSAEFSPIILVLAAGNSKRFQGVKQIADVKSEHNVQPMLCATLDKLVNLPCPIVVATGRYHEQLLALNHHDLDFYYCDSAYLGMGHTIAQGTRYVMQQYPKLSHIFLVLADQVALVSDDYQSLLSEAQDHPGRIICCKTLSGLSAPTIFPKRYNTALTQLRGDKGAKSVLNKHMPNVIAMNTPNAMIDIDTQHDLIQWNQTQFVPNISHQQASGQTKNKD